MRRQRILRTDRNKEFGGKRIITILLALAGIGAMVYYANCRDLCSYLAGSLGGIGLEYIGIAFMTAVIAASFAGFEGMLRAMLAAGIGGELFLVGYQIGEGVFCPYCLFFAAMLILAFLVNHRRPERKLTYWYALVCALGEISIQQGEKARTVPLSLFTLLSLFFFIFLFSGSAVTAYAEDVAPAVHGGGPIEIRIYSDYFCAPCRALEPEMEKAVDRIISRKKAGVVFVDTPVHKQTPLYARFFYYATSADRSYERARTVRKVLFEAAGEKIGTEAELAGYLKAKGIQLSTIGAATAYFKTLSRYIKSDRITLTPSCVIISQNEKQTYTSKNKILTVLQDIAKL